MNVPITITILKLVYVPIFEEVCLLNNDKVIPTQITEGEVNPKVITHIMTPKKTKQKTTSNLVVRDKALLLRGNKL